MDALPRWEQLAARTEVAGVEFLHADLALCFTLVQLAGTELSLEGAAAAQRVLQKARDGHATITPLLAHSKDEEEREGISRELARLRAAIETAEARLRPKTDT